MSSSISRAIMGEGRGPANPAMQRPGHAIAAAARASENARGEQGRG